MKTLIVMITLLIPNIAGAYWCGDWCDQALEVCVDSSLVQLDANLARGMDPNLANQIHTQNKIDCYHNFDVCMDWCYGQTLSE